MQKPIVNLSQSQLQSPVVPHIIPPPSTSPIPSTTITPSTTIQVPQTVQTPLVSTISTSTPLRSPIFTESTTTTTTTTQPPPIPNEESQPEENDVFHVSDDDEVAVAGSFPSFQEPVLADSLLDDERDLDDETTTAPATRKDYQILNRKLNALVHRVDSFSPTNFKI
ncbi:unnamed protein product [Lactuca virosa]|uniref:Uncharacterized protein n=1 Tax=Lactuca virosa TaxID=75947 RepID=A0AAU9MLQ0_9ASTR|nr:unnamed protein product [Lactuca virosa]